MKTCKLEISVDLNGNEKYIAYEDSVETQEVGKSVISRLDEVQSNDVEDVYVFLMDRGVEESEINAAFLEMEKNGHNKANFGTFGSFISTSFEGLLH